MPAIQTTHDLFGPQPGSGNGFQFTPNADWQVLTAFTANTKSFHFQLPTAKILFAEWRLVWLPTAQHLARLRWHHNVNGEMQFTEIGEIVPAVTGGPIPSALNITAAMQAAQASGLFVHVGQSFKGDGATPMVLYEAHLTIHWRVGYHGNG